MPRYLILAQSQITAKALDSWIELLGEEPLPKNDPRRIVWDRNVYGIECYEALARCIESAATGEHSSLLLNDVVVLVDSVNPSDMNIIDESWQWSSLVAMLILTFPEIRWVFGVCKKNKNGNAAQNIKARQGSFAVVGRAMGNKKTWEEDIEPHHSLASLCSPHRRDPLFDPTYLRDWVREETNEALSSTDDLVLPCRSKLAAAIDEEKSYAYMHGYVAYRFGYRADAVTTWNLMKERFGGANKKKPHGYTLLLEDMSLNFPDRPGRSAKMHMLRLDARGNDDCCPMLDSTNSSIENSKHRILITTGQTRPRDDALAENREYLRNKVEGSGKIILKPVSGMFDLWDKIGLFKKNPGSRRKGNEETFCWPPEPAQERPVFTDGHGSPGKLLLVAEALVQRAGNIFENVKAVGDAVQGAVLATDALELTGGRTPTTAFEALSLKHQLEVTAECQFSGVEYHIQVKPRLKEIADEVAVIGRWFASSQRVNATLNAEMHILNQLVRILRNYNQFDEEQTCMSRVRHLHNKLWTRQEWRRWPMRPILWYLELLLRSFSGFVVILMVWIFGLSILYWWTATYADWGYGFSDAVTSFLSIGPPTHPTVENDKISVGNAVVINLAIVSGFVHLGVFITHLYSIIARR